MGGSRTLCLLVLVPLLAVVVYYCVQTVRVEITVKTTIRSSVEKVFDFLKNPEVFVKIHNKDLEELIILEYTPNMLDEQDGLFKDHYDIQLTQNLPLKYSIRLNATVRASSDQKTVETDGNILGFLFFRSVDSVKDHEETAGVEVTRYNALLVPRVVDWIATRCITDYQHQILRNLKEEMEKHGVEQGTQTD